MAAVVNDSVVAIKVDREERPDIDAVYMTATQAMTGQGGWPMTVFMTPEGEPFYCGTYFPRAQFVQLVTSVSEAWRKNKAQIKSESERISVALAENASALSGLDGAGDGLNLEAVTATAVDGLARGFDFVSPELELSFNGRSLMPEVTGNPVGDPRELLVWFVNHCAAMGITIERDWTLTTGSYVGAHKIDEPGIVRGHIDGLGEVEIELT